MSLSIQSITVSALSLGTLNLLNMKKAEWKKSHEKPDLFPSKYDEASKYPIVNSEANLATR